MIISLSINTITADLIRGLFRRKGRSCSGYQCRECISDSNCSYNKYCSGGSCLARGSSCSSSSQCSGSQSCRGGSCSYWWNESNMMNTDWIIIILGQRKYFWKYNIFADDVCIWKE